MDHPVAVRAEQHEVGQAGQHGSRGMEGQYVVNLDVALSDTAVGPSEVEVTDFASDIQPGGPDGGDLRRAKSRVTFPAEVCNRYLGAFMSTNNSSSMSRSRPDSSGSLIRALIECAKAAIFSGASMNPRSTGASCVPPRVGRPK